MSVDVGFTRLERGDARLVFYGAVGRAVEIGKTCPWLNASEGRAASLPDKYVLEIGKVDLYPSLTVFITKSQRSRLEILKNYCVDLKIFSISKII